MTQVKIDSKVVTDVAEALEDRAPEMFRNREGRWMAIVELAHVERTEPGPDEEKDAAVKLRIVSVEVAPDEYADERLRESAQDLYKRRTRAGTLDEVDETFNGVRAGDLLRHGSGVLSDA